MNTYTLPLTDKHFLKDKQGNKTYALLPIEDYNELVEKANAYETYDEYTLQAIERGLKDAETGNFVSHEEVMESARKILEKYMD